MPIYLKKNPGEITRQAIEKVLNQTNITSMSPGSIARAIIEAITSEMGDIYDIMDFNFNQNLLSTATGSALDALGSLYNISRKTVNTVAAADKQIGAFYFYIQSPVISDIVIPSGTKVFTDATGYVGRRFSYSTSATATIIAGRTKTYVGLTPDFTDSTFTAGANTLILSDFQNPIYTTVFCTNPKEIAQAVNYETDDSYRLRIIKNLRTSSGGTIEAIRFAALGVSGIRDVSVRQAPYGMGSFEAIIVPEQNGDASQIIANAQAAMEAIRPVGVRMFTKSPTTLSMDIQVQLIMPGASVQALGDQATRRAEVGILRYINSLLPGNTVVYNRLVSIILDSSELVKDVIIKSYSVNGSEVLRNNYQPASDEQVIPGTIKATAATA